MLPADISIPFTVLKHCGNDGSWVMMMMTRGYLHTVYGFETNAIALTDPLTLDPADISIPFTVYEQ